MDPDALLDALYALCLRLGIPVREEPFDGAMFADLGARGGLCSIGGRRVILLDTALSREEKTAVLLRGLSLVDTDNVPMAPYIRERMEKVVQAMREAQPKKKAKLRLVRR